jgi:serine/threonine protein kinase
MSDKKKNRVIETVLSSLPPPLGRDRVGRYEIVCPLAQGGMASVYVGRLLGMAGFERLVAVKLIHPHLAAESSFVEMFLDEARIAARIHHPNIGEIIEVGEDDGLYFMVGELIVGQNLRMLGKKNRKTGRSLPPAFWAKIIAHVCRGLHAAHELKGPDGEPLGLVHRDISPRNILVSYDGFIKLIDFGVALAKGRITHTDVGTVKGKIGYMSPEQVSGEVVDRRGDIFGLGVVLYQMVTWKLPFPGKSDIEKLQKVASGDFIHPSKHVAGFDKSLEDLILKAMTVDPADRFPTALAMQEELEKYVQDSGENVGTKAMSDIMHELFDEEHEAHLAELRKHKSGKTLKSDDDEKKSNVAEGRFKASVASRFLFPAIGVAAVILVLVFVVQGLFGDSAGKGQQTAKADAPVITIGHLNAMSEEIRSENKEVEKMKIAVSISPKDAIIQIDGRPQVVRAGYLELDKDGASHKVLISAAGYQSHSQEIVAGEDLAIIVELKEIEKLKEPKNLPKGKPRPVRKSDISLEGSPYR